MVDFCRSVNFSQTCGWMVHDVLDLRRMQVYGVKVWGTTPLPWTSVRWVTQFRGMLAGNRSGGDFGSFAAGELPERLLRFFSKG